MNQNRNCEKMHHSGATLTLIPYGNCTVNHILLHTVFGWVQTSATEKLNQQVTGTINVHEKKQLLDTSVILTSKYDV